MSARVAYEFNLRNWNDIQDHLPRLMEAARGDCLEIGTRRGCSTSALLTGLEEHGGHLYSLDINDCRVFEGHPQWTFIKADSLFPERIQGLPPKFELAFIDGDHTYEGALKDLENFGSRARKVFVHDTNAPDFPGVFRAVTEYCYRTKRHLKFYPESFGMAEIG